MHTPIALIAITQLGLGCAVEGEAEAGRAMQAMLTILGPKNTAATEIVPPGLHIFGLPAITTTIPCPDGGEVTLDGLAWPGRTSLLYVEGWEAYEDLAVDFSVEAKFRRCKIDELKLRGKLRYSLTVEVDEISGGVLLDWHYSGSLKIRGEVQGKCEIDMHSKGTSPGAFDDIEAREHTDTMCGYDAEAIAEYAALDEVDY